MKIQFVQRYWALICTLLFLSIFWTIRNVPANHMLDIHTDRSGGDYGATVYRAYSKAMAQVKRPDESVAYYFLFHGHNPSIYQAFTILTMKMGATDYIASQFISALFSLIGAAFFYFWVRLLFQSAAMANIAVLLLAFMPFLPYYGSVIHHHPYSFFGFNMAILGATLFVNSKNKKWIIMAVAGYMIACLNYWMFYMSTFLILAGIHWYKTGFRKSIPYVFTYGASAVLAVFIVISLMALESGGYKNAFTKLVNKGAYRTLEISSKEKQGTKNAFLNFDFKKRYPQILNERVSTFWYLPLDFYLALFLLSVFITPREERRKYFLFLFIIPAGLSWFAVMLNHTAVHPFSAIYGFFCWILIAANFYYESFRSIKRQVTRWKDKISTGNDKARLIVFSLLNAGVVVIFLNGINYSILSNLQLYFSNLT
ncbi:MAG: hypothetical protein ABUK01_02115 [Leptospirales bacterium]